MNPELQAIQKKYNGKKDNDSMMAMQQETKEVYAKYGSIPYGQLSAAFDPDADPVLRFTGCFPTCLPMWRR